MYEGRESLTFHDDLGNFHAFIAQLSVRPSACATRIVFGLPDAGGDLAASR